MPFIGNQPAEKYSSFQKQDFTTSATTSYTLDHPVANGNEIALFINFVRQEPTAAYTASGTSLTLTSATTSSDDMYCVYLGKAVQTVTPASGSVTGDMLSKPLNYDSGTLYLDDTNNRVGIGTTSPNAELEVKADTPEIRIDATSASGRNYKIHSDGDELYIEGIGSSGSLQIGEDGTYGVQADFGTGELKFNSGYGSAATAYGCRAWVNFTQVGTQTIRGSGGVSSLTDQGTGATDVNFSTNMPDTNYAECLSLARGLLSTGAQQFPITVPNAANVGYAEVASRQCDNDNNTFTTADAGDVYVSFFR